jgi:uncharacterized cupredoxin-like copper-binding protein
MSLRNLVLLSIVGLVLAACTGGSGGAASAAPPASVAPPASTAPSNSASTRIEVKLTDAIKMEPATITVPAGVPVTFVVTNTGAGDHEFYLGDEAAQAKHEAEMRSMGGMMHDDPDGIAVKPGQTKELTYTFAKSGQTLAGCHQPNHYGAGMKVAITVTG